MFIVTKKGNGLICKIRKHGLILQCASAQTGQEKNPDTVAL